MFTRSEIGLRTLDPKDKEQAAPGANADLLLLLSVRRQKGIWWFGVHPRSDGDILFGSSALTAVPSKAYPPSARAGNTIENIARRLPGSILLVPAWSEPV
jgi:hypothetical protein